MAKTLYCPQLAIHFEMFKQIDNKNKSWMVDEF